MSIGKRLQRQQNFVMPSNYCDRLWRFFVRVELRIHGYRPDEEALEVDWPRFPPRNLHHQNRSALDARGKAKEGPSEDHVAADGREGNKADGEDLEQQSSHGKGPVDVEGSRCCSTCHPA